MSVVAGTAGTVQITWLPTPIFHSWIAQTHLLQLQREARIRQGCGGVCVVMCAVSLFKVLEGNCLVVVTRGKVQVACVCLCLFMPGV